MSSRTRRFVGDIRRVVGNFISGADSAAADSVAVDSTSFLPPSAPKTFSPTQGFGVTIISDEEALFASQREPVIKWLVYWVAGDIFDNWFKVVDPENPEDSALDEAVQRVLLELDAKRQLTRLTMFERRYGTAVMLCAYTNIDEESWGTSIYDESGSLMGDRRLLQITPYPWTKVNIIDRDTSEWSFRYGWPEFYEITRGDALAGTKAHWSRVIHAATRLDEETYEGESVIYAIYDDATGFRNARWAQYETLFRYGSGFAHIHLPGATRKEIQSWISAGHFDDINARGFFVSGGVGDEAEFIEFIGVKGVTLDPGPYNEMAAWNLAMASRIPQDVLKGVSAGRVTGSEVNERAYFKFISAEQSNIEHIVRELVDRIIETGQVQYSDGRRHEPTKEYVIEWSYPQLTPELSQAQIDFLTERAQAERLKYMTIDEVRAKADPPLLPHHDEEIGKMIPGGKGEFSEFASNPERRTEEKTTEDEMDDKFNDAVLREALNDKG